MQIVLSTRRSSGSLTKGWGWLARERRQAPAGGKEGGSWMATAVAGGPGWPQQWQAARGREGSHLTGSQLQLGTLPVHKFSALGL